MENKIIIACDFTKEKDLMDFLNHFHQEKLFLKVGYELFYALGNSTVESLKKLGHHIFLDLKLYDIPNTVEHGVNSLMQLQPDLLSIHASGSIAMMQAAMRGVGHHKTKLVAITELTSFSQEVITNELLINHPIETIVVQYARNAKMAGINHVVCSVWESKIIKEKVGQDMYTITPGIRMAKNNDDQKRVATIQDAKNNLVDYVVIGRPITQASQPYETYLNFKKQFQGA